jgi:uncharacterized protein YjbJ (UPF0337 family)
MTNDNGQFKRFPATIEGQEAEVLVCERSEPISRGNEEYPMLRLVLKEVNGDDSIELRLSAAMLLRAVGQDYANRLWGQVREEAGKVSKEALHEAGYVAKRVADIAVALGTPIAEDLKKQAEEVGARVAGRAKEIVGSVFGRKKSPESGDQNKSDKV